MDNKFKDNNLAKKLLTEGLALKEEGKFYDALVKYNASLCNAVMGSEEMALAYANRSIIYFEHGYYDIAISNSQKALQNSCPDKMRTAISDLMKNSEKYLNAMTKEVTEDFFRLSYNPNPQYPSFADCIELRSNEKFGRYLITNRDLNVGDIIAIEEFSFYSINKGWTESKPGSDTPDELINYQVCSFCLKSNLLDLHPCPKCAFTMHCSEKCYQDHFHRGHKFECGLMTELMKIPEKHFIFKSFFAALSICESMAKLIELIDEAESFRTQLTVFDFDFSQMTQQEKDKKFIQLMYLSHRKEISKEAKNSLCNVIEKVFNSDVTTKEWLKVNKEFIIKFMTRIWEVKIVNSFAIDLELPRTGMCLEIAGTCVCPGLTLLSHSCIPNVARIENGKNFALVVTRKIQEDEQIFTSYSADFMVEPKSKRQEFLEQFGFICDCEACEQNLPTYEESEFGTGYQTADRLITSAQGFYSCRTPQSRVRSTFNETLSLINNMPSGYNLYTLNKAYNMLSRALVLCLAFLFYAGEKLIKE